MVKKQRVIPRLKPVPYTLSDLTLKLKQPQLLPSGISITHESENVELYSTPDLPNNKRGFKYQPCRPNPILDSKLYSTTDLPPYNTHWSYFDRSSDMMVSSDMSIVATQESHGWRSSRSNISIREGKWYIEYKIINGINDAEKDQTPISDSRSCTPSSSMNHSAHVRMGIARPDASLEAPVGFDGYGYGIRDINCETIHLSRRSQIINGSRSDLKVGDVIGLLVELPDFELQKDIAKSMIIERTLSDPSKLYGPDESNDSLLKNSFIENGVQREMIPIRYKGELYFEEYEYTGSKKMEHLLNPVTVFGEHAIPDKERFQPAKLPHSSITLFVNGENRGKPFTNMFAFLPPASEQKAARNSKHKKIQDDIFAVDNDDGSLGYFPMVSCFRGGAVQLNTSTNIWKVPASIQEAISKGEIKPYGSRFKEKITEEIVNDLIDNAVNKYLDRKEIEFSG
ncbi:hypothetical protein CANINC_004617 [Pichia inconspicua]|uniref:B30.2/SPRY domain-containing protein n=1 Tax=Pichia inconspicua TaxID=52247 RepID=A0A4V4NF60_9ASCO|nr:hypothetical protein CANINC_004617 [[Candida] inconspicua]